MGFRVGKWEGGSEGGGVRRGRNREKGRKDRVERSEQGRVRSRWTRSGVGQGGKVWGRSGRGRDGGCINR